MVKGGITKDVSSHPTGLNIELDADDKIIRLEELYVNAGFHQLVVTSEQPIDCQRKVEVIGTLDIVTISVNEEDSYQSYWIESDSIRCN